MYWIGRYRYIERRGLRWGKGKRQKAKGKIQTQTQAQVEREVGEQMTRLFVKRSREMEGK